MTNTTVAFRITATCHYCTHRFTPQVRRVAGALEIQCDDHAERLCCDDCLHDVCCAGHATETERALCEGDSLYPAGEQSDFDYDAWADAVAHTLVER